MLYNSGKKFLNAFVLVFLCLFFTLSCFAENFISRKKIDEIYVKFARISCFEKYFKENSIYKELSFEAKSTKVGVSKGCLIPLDDCEELKRGFISTRAKEYADAEHMRFYMSGNLSSEQNINSLFKYRVERMWNTPPKSLYFGIAVEDAKTEKYSIVGDILVGSLMGGDGDDCVVECVLSKEFSGKGIGFAAANCFMRLVEKLVLNVEAYTSLKCVKATAKVDNIASNRILEKLGFKRVEERPCRVNKQMMEYYYEYAIKHE